MTLMNDVAAANIGGRRRRAASARHIHDTCSPENVDSFHYVMVSPPRFLPLPDILAMPPYAAASAMHALRSTFLGWPRRWNTGRITAGFDSKSSDIDSEVSAARAFFCLLRRGKYIPAKRPLLLLLYHRVQHLRYYFLSLWRTCIRATALDDPGPATSYENNDRLYAAGKRCQLLRLPYTLRHAAQAAGLHTQMISQCTSAITSGRYLSSVLPTLATSFTPSITRRPSSVSIFALL